MDDNHDRQGRLEELVAAAATGLGGIGKTQLAAEFAHRYGQYFAGGVFWLSFADPAAIPAEIAACGGAMALHPDFGNLPLEDQVRLVSSAWQSPQPRLLIFDNCEDEALLAQLRDQGLLDHVSLQGRGADWSPTAHELHVARTFALSYDKLNASDETGSMALKLLARAACFAPGEPIPRPLLLSTLDLPAEELEAQLLAEDGLGRLVALGLLEAEAGGALLLHRLVAAFVERAEPDEGARATVEAALLYEANRLNNAGFPAPLLAWQPHLRAVIDVAAAREDERAAELCHTLGYHLKMIGDYTGARPYLERALAIRELVTRQFLYFATQEGVFFDVIAKGNRFYSFSHIWRQACQLFEESARILNAPGHDCASDR